MSSMLLSDDDLVNDSPADETSDTWDDDLVEDLPADETSDDIWNDLMPRIERGDILPIVGNGVLNDLVFASLIRKTPAVKGGDAEQGKDAGVSAGRSPGDAQVEWVPRTVDEKLAKTLANAEKYPFADTCSLSLARVMQYKSYSESHLDARAAKNAYLRFLKRYLIGVSRRDPEIEVSEADVRRLLQSSMTFSQVAEDLGYPRVPAGQTDPLELLADLPLPVYLTTSYYRFLERAIEIKGRTPRTHVCFWSSKPKAGDRYQPNPNSDPEPDPEHPVVYHLYGFEERPETIVLSEDDYLDFLFRMAQDSAVIWPSYLTTSLAASSLVLIGYRPQDWDFRILFRGVLTRCFSATRTNASVAIQLEPYVRGEVKDPEQAKQRAEAHLERYFKELKFTIQWSDVYTFTADLMDRWKQYQKGKTSKDAGGQDDRA